MKVHGKALFTFTLPPLHSRTLHTPKRSHLSMNHLENTPDERESKSDEQFRNSLVRNTFKFTRYGSIPVYHSLQNLKPLEFPNVLVSYFENTCDDLTKLHRTDTLRVYLSGISSNSFTMKVFGRGEIGPLLRPLPRILYGASHILGSYAHQSL